MLNFARSNTISTQTSNNCLNQLGQFAEVYMLLVVLEALSLETPIATAFHPSHMSRLTGSDRSPLYQQTPPVRSTDVPRTLPPLRTPSLEHLHSRPMNAKPWPIIIIYLSILIRVTIWVCEILTLFRDFRYQIFESIPELYKHKSWVKDIIQGFAQKAVSPSCVVHIMQCVKLNNKMS